jgi:hypothetical protein
MEKAESSAFLLAQGSTSPSRAQRLCEASRPGKGMSVINKATRDVRVRRAQIYPLCRGQVVTPVPSSAIQRSYHFSSKLTLPRYIFRFTTLVQTPAYFATLRYPTHHSSENTRLFVPRPRMLVSSLHARAYSSPRYTHEHTRFLVPRTCILASSSLVRANARCAECSSVASPTAKCLYIAGILPFVTAHLIGFPLYRITFSRHYSISSRVTSHSKD